MPMHPAATDLLYFPPFPHYSFLFLAIIVAWTIVLKGFALWHAARNDQRAWFIVMLIVNTLGLLEIVYLIWFRPDKTGSEAGESGRSLHSDRQPEGKG